MSRSTALIRIRFPQELVARLDWALKQLEAESGTRIPRAALVRALVQMELGALDSDRPKLEELIHADPVKKGKRTTPRSTLRPQKTPQTRSRL